MEILKCKLNSVEEGNLDVLVVSEDDSGELFENGNNNKIRVKINEVFTEKLLDAIRRHKDKFECNNYYYSIISQDIFNQDYLDEFEFDLEKTKKIKFEKPDKVWLYKNKCRCLTCENKYGTNAIENRKGIFKTQAGREISIDVQFCRTCQSYYMDEQSLKLYEENYGLLMCKRDYLVNGYKRESDLSFNEKTILSENGYSAHAKGPSDIQRKSIIDFILRTEKAERYQLKEILSQFISLRGDKYPDAALKWKRDLDYINSLESDKYFDVTGIKKK